MTKSFSGMRSGVAKPDPLDFKSLIVGQYSWGTFECLGTLPTIQSKALSQRDVGWTTPEVGSCFGTL
jgi:hypothetical protein